MSDPRDAQKVQLIYDLKAVIRDTQALMQASLDDGKSGSQALRKSMSEEFGRAIERLRRMEVSAGERIHDSAARAQTYVRNHPLQALGISAGIGLLVGLLFRRR